MDALISDRLQNAADGCDSFRGCFEHLESRLTTAMGDTSWTHIYDELQKIIEDTKSQNDGMRELEKKLEGQADELRADLKSHEQVTIGLVLNNLPGKEEAPHRDLRKLPAGRHSRVTPAVLCVTCQRTRHTTNQTKPNQTKPNQPTNNQRTTHNQHTINHNQHTTNNQPNVPTAANLNLYR